MLSAYQTDKFDLSASPGTADGYPVTIDQGRFFASTSGGFFILSGHSCLWDALDAYDTALPFPL